MSDEVDGALTALALGAFLVLYARFEMTLWGDDDVEALDRNSYTYGIHWGMRLFARWLNRYARPAGYVLVALGALLLLLALI